MGAIDNGMIRRFAEKNRGLVDDGGSFVTSPEAGLRMVPMLPDQNCSVPMQQRKIWGMVKGFSHEINRHKTLTRDVWSGKLLQDLNLHLFGFLGDASRHEDEADEFPRSTCLLKSKSFFSHDLGRMVDVVGQWRLQSGRVVISSELEFSIGGESEAFFQTLFWLRKIMDGSDSGKFYVAQWARKTFGVYPGEHLGRGVDSVWSPEDTAVLIRKSLTDENTINRVGNLINGIKRDHCVSIVDTDGTGADRAVDMRNQTFDEFGYIEQISLEDLKRIVYTDYRNVHLVGRNNQIDSYRVSRFELDVTEIIRAEEYAGQIPSDVMDNLEGFLSSLVKPLSHVPFVLTPELYILTGPVKIRTTVVNIFTDPLLILRFAEFPGLLIPVEYWLPVSRVYSLTGDSVI